MSVGEVYVTKLRLGRHVLLWGLAAFAEIFVLQRTCRAAPGWFGPL
jgi:hypothetical protein